MKQTITRSLCLVLVFVLALSLAVPVFGASAGDARTETAAFLLEQTPKGQMGSIGGDWTVFVLVRGGGVLPADYGQTYYAAVASAVRACDGVLDAKKYTEHSRVILALSALGKNARDVAGYDLTAPLGDFDGTVRQGINGAIWALLALDCRDYPMPLTADGKTQATRQMYVDYILERALPDGGWNFMCDPESEAEPDMTGMALMALAPYQNRQAVADAVEAALARMSAMQNDAGGFTSWGAPNLEGSAQMLAALCTLNIDVNDPRFVKNGRTLTDALLDHYTQGKGFAHSSDSEGADLMASEQAMLGLIALERARTGKSALFDLRDAKPLAAQAHPDVAVPSVTARGAAFPDTSDEAVLALAEREIVSGMGDGEFHPDETMTRAQFAAIVVRALGLEPKCGETFDDVPAERWYAPYVDTAAKYGIVHGRSEGIFDPEGTITRQEAGILLEQAAALCGGEVGGELRGSEAVTRAEMAGAVYALLQSAKLL